MRRRRRWQDSIHVSSALAAALLVAGAAVSGDWLPIVKDSIHDPSNPAVKTLQNPREALSHLPPDEVGNQVRWVKALEEGFIEPRTNIREGTEIRVLDLDILMKGTGDAPYVLFPHRPHTEWLDCANCHDKIFASEAGATPMSMLMILNGYYCGQCHGAVSFPLTECKRCHSVPAVPSLPETVAGSEAVITK